jgi:hypothetical protein
MQTIPRNENMHEIITEFNVSQAGADLFLNWQNELRLRKQIRSGSSQDAIIIENNDEFQFLKRCLYYGPGQQLFFEILYRNMANLTILTCVIQSPPDLMSGFLAFVGLHILKHKPSIGDLQFLITMYREEFRPDFIELFNRMDHELCTQLLARTSNNDMRNLINHRQLHLSREVQTEHYGLVYFSHPANDYPTIYGDKIQIMAAAVKALKGSQSFDLSAEPLNRETLETLLDSGDMLFRAGLLADCLAILTKMVNRSGMDEHSLILSMVEPYYQRMDGLLRKVLPIYALLVSPTNPHRYALELYRSLFPGFGPDPASLLYLDIQSIVMASLQGHRQYANYELAQKGGKILGIRSDDAVACILLKSGNQLTPEDLSGLEQAIKQRIPYYPHEVYIIMEVLRLWQHEGRITLTRQAVSSLLHGYLQFFSWIPAAPFMNEHVHNQLGLLADEKTRTASEQVLAVIQNSARVDSAASINPASNDTGYEVNNLSQKLLISKYMGVL